MANHHHIVDDFGNLSLTCRCGFRCLSAFQWHDGGVLSLMNAITADI